jgi:hypothetical protein
MKTDTVANAIKPRRKRIAVLLHVRRAFATGVVAGILSPKMSTMMLVKLP